MFKRYSDLWREYTAKYGSRTAILLLVGKFYELYDIEDLDTGKTQCNIREIADACQLSVIERPGSDNHHQTLFGGVPEHALESKYEHILIQAGFTVVIVAQHKDGSGSVKGRVVERISSPGCYLDPGLGPAKDRFLVGLVVESRRGGPSALLKSYWAATSLDLATGSIVFTEGADRDRLHPFLCVHPPSELVLWSDGLPAANALCDATISMFPTVTTHRNCLTPASASIDEAQLDAHWRGVRYRPGFQWMFKCPQARRCLAALMEFAADHIPSALKALKEPEPWVPQGDLRLGNAALEQLGMFSKDKQSLYGLMDQCRTAGGKRLMRSRLMKPITNITELEARLDRIAAATNVAAIATTAATERALRSICDTSLAWRRIELGRADFGDLARLLRSYVACRDLIKCGFTGLATTYIDDITAHWSLPNLMELSRGDSTVPVDCLPYAADGTELGTLFAEGLSLRQEAEKLCAHWSILKDSRGTSGTVTLDDAEGGGFRITGPKKRIASVLAALRDAGDKSVRSTPYKVTTLLECAALDAINERHRTWMHAWIPMWTAHWSAALAELVDRGRDHHQQIEAWCADVDLSWTVGRIAAEWKWTRPEFAEQDTSFVSAVELRHPVIEQIRTVPYVAHTIALGSSGEPGPAPSGEHGGDGILLYGMNASGKSSLMKSVGLSVMLAQCGMPVPATSFRLAPFTALFTRILGNDNMWGGQSTFTVEMTEFREILRAADGCSLVLGDELCSGTESLSATALVAAGVEELAARHTKFVFATHLHELSTLPDILLLPNVRLAHLRVQYDEARDLLVYDRTLTPGSGSALYGLEVCRALDLPPAFLERARSVRQALAREHVARPSAYSKESAVTACEVCGSKVGRLETHHIIPQKAKETNTPTRPIHSAGNLVCLCETCHDDHHGNRIRIDGWEETSAGRRLRWSRQEAATATAELDAPVVAWIREQRRLKNTIPTIRRNVLKIMGVEVTDAQIRGIHPKA